MSGVLDDEGPAAPPRSNGELVFSEPWESTAFAMAMGLVESGTFTHDEFRERLAEAIAAWDALPPGDRGEWSYYERWLQALQSLLFERGVIGDLELHERITDLDHQDHHH